MPRPTARWFPHQKITPFSWHYLGAFSQQGLDGRIAAIDFLGVARATLRANEYTVHSTRVIVIRCTEGIDHLATLMAAKNLLKNFENVHSFSHKILKELKALKTLFFKVLKNLKDLRVSLKELKISLRYLGYILSSLAHLLKGNSTLSPHPPNRQNTPNRRNHGRLIERLRRKM